MSDYYVKLDDVLALLPETDIVGPKPSRLRKEVQELKKIIPFSFVDVCNDTMNKNKK